MNLLEEFGAGYINERCNNAVFLHPEGWTGMYLEGTLTSGVRVRKIEGYVGRLSVSDETLPCDFFEGLHVFNVPELGWRSALNGRAMMYLSHAGGYGRGVRPGNNLRVEYSQMTQSFIGRGGVSSNYLSRTDVRAKIATTPEHLTLAEGLALMREGTHAGFSISPTLAVTASDDEEVGILYVRTTPVGTVNLSSGAISASISIPSLNISGANAA